MSLDDFWAQLLARGAWWDPEYAFRDWRRTLRTPSGKFQFYAPGIEAQPRFEPTEAVGQAREFPLILNVFRPLAFTGGRTANMPYLREIAGKHVSAAWESWLEISPVTARGLAIGDGDIVRVESTRGQVIVRARFNPGTPPDVVSIPYGLGHEVGGRWAARAGINPNELVGVTAAPVTGGSVYPITRVRVVRA
jgi:anaerobic selenocysteine-containing dehydrogenase